MNGTVLITDGRSLAALAVARSLGSKGVDVHVGEEFAYSITPFSRYVDRSYEYPSVEDHPDEFARWFAETNARERYDAVIPVRDATTLFLARNARRLGCESELFVSDPETIESLMDKRDSMRLASEQGVPIPKTYYPTETGLDEIRSKARFPVLVKPRIASGARGIVRVDRPSDLRHAYRRVDERTPEPIVQEYVDHSGGHYSIGTLFDRESEPVATHVYREIRQYPHSGGPATSAVSVEKAPWVEEMIGLLRAVGWRGPAHMDVLYDPADGSYKLLEVNPRFWMSLALTVESGVDIPALLYDLITTGTTQTVRTYDTDLLYRWVFPNELLWLLSSSDKPNALKELWSETRTRTCYGTVSVQDPTPIVGVVAQSLRYIASAENRRTIFGRGWENDAEDSNR